MDGRDDNDNARLDERRMMYPVEIAVQESGWTDRRPRLDAKAVSIP